MGNTDFLSGYIEKIYHERKRFIIIGLTGRTGAGCTATSELLRSNVFYSLKAPKPQTNNFYSKDERSYKVVYDYLKDVWKPFFVIKASSVIVTFLLEYDYKKFAGYVKSIAKEKKKKLPNNFLDDLKDEFESLSEERKKYKKDVEDNNGYILPELSNEMKNFYFERVSKFHEKLEKKIRDMDSSFYTELWQNFGTNIRLSGNPYNDDIDTEKVLLFPQRINLHIKILRAISKQNPDIDIRVVIDALRNPLEVMFFKERYASFYLISITAPKEVRKNRLIKKGYNEQALKDLEETESGESKKLEKLHKIEYFISQDVQSCINMADIFIHNESEVDTSYLAKQLVCYIALMIHPGLIVPSAEERCMQTAFNMAANSGCISRQVGAVVTDENYSILSVGWNDVPKGQVSCNLRNLNDLMTYNDKTAFSDFEKGDKDFRDFLGRKYESFRDKIKNNIVPFCFKDAYIGCTQKQNQVHTRALHAEENAFLQLAVHGTRLLRGGNLFTSSSPCELCAKKAYQLGIQKIYFIEQYSGISEAHILNNGKNRPTMIYFCGAVGRAYTQLYQNSIPLKDEYEMRYDMQLKKAIEAE